MYDMEARNYMADIGRWGVIDELAENFDDLSPYNFSNNNPIIFSDPSGLAPKGIASTFVDPNGRVVEHRDDNDDNVYLVGSGWKPGGSKSGLSVVGHETPGETYRKGDKVLMDFNGYAHVQRMATGAATQIGGPFDIFGVWEAFYTELFSEIGDDSPEAALAFAVVTKGKAKSKSAIRLLESLPNQLHHFATNKNKKWTPLMEAIAKKYGLSLNGAWNKQILPHLGRHPNEYHNFVYNAMRKASSQAGTNKEQFLKLFNQYVQQPVIDNPELLRKSGW